MIEKKLRPKQRLAIAALLNSPTHAAAAKKAGCGLRTLQRWMNEEAFQNAVDDALDDVTREAKDILRKESIEAAQTIVKVMKGKVADVQVARVRLKASMACLGVIDGVVQEKLMGDYPQKIYVNWKETPEWPALGEEGLPPEGYVAPPMPALGEKGA